MKILLATGGSGGHIFPALQTALELKRRGHEIFFAGVLGIAQEHIEKSGFQCHNIGATGFQDHSIVGILRFGFSMMRAVGQSFGIIGRLKPDKIIGFGGYGAFPVILAGGVLRYSTMIHEQNVLPGKANRILAKCVKKIAVSFKHSIQYFSPGKSVWTGCPCHDQPSARSRADICGGFGFKPEERIVVLLGGSQGSQRLNEVFYNTMLCQKGMQALHMTGKKEYDHYARKYKQAGLSVVVSAFISPIEDIYAIADVVISRAGAATISELGAFVIPAVLVPYPFAGNHQKYNARVLSDAGTAVLLEQKDLTIETLGRAIEQCGSTEFSRERIAQKNNGLFIKKAALHLADAVEQL